MKTFLEYVAEDILNKYGNNLANVTVVFPNKRASLFLNEAFAEISTQPVLTPEYKTINELFLSGTDYKVADSIELVCLLYKVYKEITGSDETLDHFFSWGEIMISDFDDIDKHLLDAHQIFTNVKDLHELDDNSFLTDEQKDVIRHFFPDFGGTNTQLKEKFLKLWSRLADIYDAFNKVLDEHHKYYEGALYRRIVYSLFSPLPWSPLPTSPRGGESETSNHFLPLGGDRGGLEGWGEASSILFVGFNHLLPVECKLFALLKEQTNVKFYWDYDEYYVKEAVDFDQEAGSDIKKNLVLFPNELKDRPEIYDNLSHEKKVRILTASTNDIQARYVSQWLNDKEKGRNTVIVLADESLLPAVLHSLPEDVGKVNITIGYKLAFTSIPLLLYNKMREKGFTDENLSLTKKIDFLIESVLNETNTESEISALTKESIFRTYTMLNQLKDLSMSGELDINEYTFKRLLNQLLNSTSVPFHGEPLEGIQIMGVLETRNLDFHNVLLLSCNEGTLPKCNDQTSFIPYFLRKAHDLSTVDNKVNIFAYYFYRLLQRAEDVTFCWNKSTDGMLRGEMSRFLLQLKEEWPHPIEELALQAQNVSPELLSKNPIEKDEKTIQKLCNWFTDHVSPTAINTYLRCQKMFYYRYVLKLKEYEDEEELTDDNRTFGNIFHHTVEELYKGFIGREVTTLALNNIRDEKRIKEIVKFFYYKELYGVGLSSSGLSPALASRADLISGLKAPREGAKINANANEQLTINNEQLAKAKAIANAKVSPNGGDLEGASWAPDGLQMIKINVLTHYVLKLIDLDLKQAPFTLLGLEYPVSAPLSVQCNGEKLTTKFGGFIDRLDKIKYDGEEVVRVVDYKTGKPMTEQKISTIEEVFNPANIDKHSDYYQQAIGYSSILCELINDEQLTMNNEHFSLFTFDTLYRPSAASQQSKQASLCSTCTSVHSSLKIYPALLFIQHSSDDAYDPILKLNSNLSPLNSNQALPLGGDRGGLPVQSYKEDYWEEMQKLLNEIFDSAIPFIPQQRSNDHTCDYCPFAKLCIR